MKYAIKPELEPITRRWLSYHKADMKTVRWFGNQAIDDPIELLELLINRRQYIRAQWLITKLSCRMDINLYAYEIKKYMLPLISDKKDRDQFLVRFSPMSEKNLNKMIDVLIMLVRKRGIHKKILTIGLNLLKRGQDYYKGEKIK